MKKFLFITLVFILLVSSFTFADSDEGSLLMVGGALRADNDAIYEEFIRLAGGTENAKIGIIPVASGSPHKYTQLFIEDMTSRGLSEEQVELIPIAVSDDSRTDVVDESTWADNGKDQGLANKVKDYTAIWFVGGDQLRITNALLDESGNHTPVLNSIWEVYQKGGVIGGTSAGAAIMSEIMIAGGDSYGALTDGQTDKYDDSSLDYQDTGGLVVTKGLGFFEDGIIDQHFDRKGRLGRLIVTGYENKEKYPVNFGIEENTALIYTSQNNKLSVKGENGVVVVDLSQSIKEKDEYKGINIGYLETTDAYNLSDLSFEMDESKYTTIGYEYFKRENPVVSGAVDADSSLKHMIAYNLIDNEAADIVKTYLFDNNPKGFVFEFVKTEATEGYWGQSGAADLYSFKDVQLNIKPVQISIEQSKEYVVQPKDVLWKIALENQTTVNEIIELNDLKNPNLIFENQIIKLP